MNNRITKADDIISAVPFGNTVLPAVLSYADVEEGMEIEYEDFWHSGILSWRKGIVEFVDYGATRIKGVVFPDRQRKRIFSHRMHQVRRPS